MTDRSPLASASPAFPPAPEAPLPGTPEPVTEPLPPPGHRRDPLTIAAVGLFVIAVLFALYFGREVLLPIMLALILSFLLRPLVRAL
ncbi:hypothetical protein [Azospirillum sp. INR13]|uniref:hypothetical protein n=1 Tax=Azospirillum sp. INR13 TaxID=2596919 RepID=UPI0021043DD8|nr:hypothetical protein [Azospirillum sp. INR13]